MSVLVVRVLYLAHVVLKIVRGLEHRTIGAY